MLQIGLGYDVHPFVENRKLILGGVEIYRTDGWGLEGHSDGDVFFHCIIDALLGMCSMGSIGEYFPETYEFKNINSGVLLKRTWDMINRKYKINLNNIDSVVISKSVKIIPIAENIKNNLSKILNLNPQKINLKGKSGNGLGVGGEDKGIEVYCTVLGDIVELQNDT
jgi:2-C-methyl-D-erythritol 2,4-cyclodiphosphate synthase